jgi:hypothetical protein
MTSTTRPEIYGAQSGILPPPPPIQKIKSSKTIAKHTTKPLLCHNIPERTLVSMSNVRPVEWHEECLANSKLHEMAVRSDFEQLRASYERNITKISQHNIDYASQIARAKRIGKKSFDRERFKKE